MKKLILPLLLLILTCLALAQRDFNIDGPMELHIWLTTKSGQEQAFEKTFREVFYPAVSARDGFRSALLMRKPGTSDYTIRLSFNTEEQRVQWVKSDAHQKAFPALTSLCKEPKWDGFAVIYPK
jgi:heme-degrading monooxygenase HmoA